MGPQGVLSQQEKGSDTKDSQPLLLFVSMALKSTETKNDGVCFFFDCEKRFQCQLFPNFYNIHLYMKILSTQV